MNIYDYLNQPNKNKTLTDEEFEKLLPCLTEQLVQMGFHNVLQEYNTQYLTDSLTDWKNLKKTKISTNHIHAQSTVGMSILKRYMTHLYDVKNHKGLSISSLWTRENIQKSLVMNRRTHSTPYVSELIRQIGFMAGTSKVTLYRPLLTKRIVEYFKNTDEFEVLDVCVGWGGRMIGSVCVEGVHYTGIEPSTKTYNALCRIQKELGLVDCTTLYHDTAESVLPTLTRKYDLALTSPPYYNLEIYTEESTQSHHYGTYEEWVDKFLRPIVHGVLNVLVKGGKSCWSVKNIKTDKSYPLYDDVVRLHQEKGWILTDMEFYVGNSIRPGIQSKDGSIKKSKEITYIFTEQ